MPKFLLAIEGPLYTVPLKLFDSAEDAVRWAKNNPATNENKQVVGDTAYDLSNDWRLDDEELFYTAEVSENYMPAGYTLWRFDEEGNPDGIAFPEPYVFREPVFPDVPTADEDDTTIDFT